MAWVDLLARVSAALNDPKHIHVDLTRDSVSAALLVREVWRRFPDASSYEPESLWLSLEDLPACNQNKLLAGLSLQSHPSFYTDPLVFAYTCLVFNDEPPMYEVVPQLSAQQAAWGRVEAALIYSMLNAGDASAEFSPDVEVYVAACLHDEGFQFTPDALSFASEELATLTQSVCKKEQMDALRGVHTLAGALTPESVQAAKLDAVDEYLQLRLQHIMDAVTS